MNPATEILLSAAFVLTPIENWFNSRKHRDIGDRNCALTAIHDAAYELRLNRYLASATMSLHQVVGQSVIGFNDSHTHAEVLDALYRAAALSEEL